MFHDNPPDNLNKSILKHNMGTCKVLTDKTVGNRLRIVKIRTVKNSKGVLEKNREDRL